MWYLREFVNEKNSDSPGLSAGLHDPGTVKGKVKGQKRKNYYKSRQIKPHEKLWLKDTLSRPLIG